VVDDTIAPDVLILVPLAVEFAVVVDVALIVSGLVSITVSASQVVVAVDVREASLSLILVA